MWSFVRSSIQSSKNTGLSVSRYDLERIYDTWLELLQQDGIEEPLLALKEMRKRINDGTKPKLNLKKCKLRDDQVIKLVEALAIKPAISKLDLSFNDLTDESIDVIIRLLKGQVKLARLVPIDERLDVAFISEVLVDNSSMVVTLDKISEIKALTDCLKHVNLKSSIRKLYKRNGAPKFMNKYFVEDILTSTVGSQDKDLVVAALSDPETSEVKATYEELESAILAHMVKKNLIPRLAKWQALEIRDSGGEDPQDSRRSSKVGSSKLQSLSRQSSKQNSSPSQYPSDHHSPGADSVTVGGEARGERERSKASSTKYDSSTSGKKRDKKDKRERRHEDSSPDGMHVSSNDQQDARSTMDSPASADNLHHSDHHRAHRRKSDYTPAYHLQTAAAEAAAKADKAMEALHELAKIPHREAATNYQEQYQQFKEVDTVKKLPTHDNAPALLPEPAVVATPAPPLPPAETAVVHTSPNPMVSFAQQLFSRIDEPTSNPVVVVSKPSVASSSNVVFNAKDTSPRVAAVITGSADRENGDLSAFFSDSSNRYESGDDQDKDEAVLNTFLRSQSKGSPDKDESGATLLYTSDELKDLASEVVRHLLPGSPVLGAGLGLSESNDENSRTITSPTSAASPSASQNWSTSREILDCSNAHLQHFFVPHIHDIAPSQFSQIRFLSLRNNMLSDLLSLGLPYLSHLVELDLAMNQFKGAVSPDSIPLSVEKLDLSHNALSNVSSLVSCQVLRALNLSHNALRIVDHLPCSLRLLDLSDNKLENTFTMRMLSLCPRLASLSLSGNPVTRKVRDWKVLISGLLPHLKEIDGVGLIGLRISPRQPTSPGSPMRSPSPTASQYSGSHARSAASRGGRDFNVHVSKANILSPSAAAEAINESLQSYAMKSLSAPRPSSPISKSKQIEADKLRHSAYALHLKHVKELQAKKKSAITLQASRSKVLSPVGINQMVRRLSVSMSDVRGGWGDASHISTRGGGDILDISRISGHGSTPNPSIDVSYSGRLSSPIVRSAGFSSPARRSINDTHGRRQPSSQQSKVEKQAAYETIREWQQNTTRELEGGASMLQLVFWMAQKEVPDPVGLAIFLRTAEQLSFIEQVSLPRLVEQAISECTDDLHQMQSVGQQLEMLVAFSALLQDVRHLIMVDGASKQFALNLNSIMSTDRGQYINSNLLRPNDCEYVFLEERNAQHATAKSAIAAIAAAAVEKYRDEPTSRSGSTLHRHSPARISEEEKHLSVALYSYDEPSKAHSEGGHKTSSNFGSVQPTIGSNTTAPTATPVSSAAGAQNTNPDHHVEYAEKPKAMSAKDRIKARLGLGGTK